MSWLDLPRVPEPEVMDDSADVEAYAGAAAQAYLARLDDGFVARAVGLLAGADQRSAGAALDIGCGPGQITRKLAARLPGWRVAGVDRSPAMLCQAECAVAATAAAGAAPTAAQVDFFLDDGTGLSFADASFDLVVCNSVLHHLEKPEKLFAEMARVARPGAAILLRDLRRPSRPAFPWHVRWYGRHYRGKMYKLYRDSVRAAYTPEELAAMLCRSPLVGAVIFTEGRTHLGFDRVLTRVLKEV